MTPLSAFGNNSSNYPLGRTSDVQACCLIQRYAQHIQYWLVNIKIMWSKFSFCTKLGPVALIIPQNYVPCLQISGISSTHMQQDIVVAMDKMPLAWFVWIWDALFATYASNHLFHSGCIQSQFHCQTKTATSTTADRVLSESYDLIWPRLRQLTTRALEP